MDDLEDRLKVLRDAIDMQSAWTARKLREISQSNSGAFWPGVSTKDDSIISSTSNTVTCHGTWTGYITMIYNSNGMKTNYKEVTGATRTFSIPSHGGGMLVHWFRRPGKAYASDLSRGSITADGNTWTTVATRTISSNDWTLSATVGWDAADRGVDYGVRVLSNGRVVAQVGPRNGLGPLTSLGDGYRTQSISAAYEGINQTNEIKLQVYAENALASRRRVRKVAGTLDWIDPNG